MSLENDPSRQKKGHGAVSDPSLTVDGFCEAESMSRSALYKAWKEKRGPDYYFNGNRRIITAEARKTWQRKQVAAAAQQAKVEEPKGERQAPSNSAE
jgi:hypothetical protein